MLPYKARTTKLIGRCCKLLYGRGKRTSPQAGRARCRSQGA